MENNDIVLESFINFCDDMMIAEEGMKDIGKGIWETIKRMFRKIITWFKNILLNINYFKNAKLDDQMNKDLLKCLQILQPKTEKTHFTILTMMYTIMKVVTSKSSLNGNTQFDGSALNITGDGVYVSKFTSFNDQIFLAIQDIDSVITAVKESTEYKRITDDEYTNKNIQDIPLSHIIPDLKNSQSKTTKFENEVNKAEGSMKRYEKYPEIIKLQNKMIKFFQKIITYYSFRISLLSKYLEKAKASLGAVSSNMKELKNKNQDGRVDNRAKGIFNEVELSPSALSRLKEIYKQAKYSTDFNEYKKLYDEIVNITKIKKGDTIENIHFSGTTITVTSIPNDNKKIPLLPSQELFHSSNDENIKVLTPRWSTGSGVLFSSPRIYFHVSNPLNRYGNKIGNGGGLYGQGSTNGLYKAKKNPPYVFIDREMGRTAVYVETNQPMPVEKVNYKEWMKAKQVKLGLDDN